MEYILREWRETDLDSLIKFANNANNTKWMSKDWRYPYTVDDGKKFLARFTNRTPPIKLFAIEIKGEAVGGIGFFPDNDIHKKNADLYFWLDEVYTGKGIMTKAVKEILEYGFKTFDTFKVYGKTFSTNIKAQAVLERAGFKLEAKYERACFKNGEFYDEFIFSKFKE